MKTWVIADTHLGHEAMCRFKNEDGTKVRPWEHAIEADREMILRWNDTVAPEDKVYHLGDVAMHKRWLTILHQLHGRKVLIRGNHDREKLAQYIKYFKDVRGCHVLDKIVLSQLPIHACSKARFRGNIHGHVHGNFVPDQFGKPDPWYYNACVEVNDYRPVLFDVIREELYKRNESSVHS